MHYKLCKIICDMNNENYGEYLKYQREQAGLSRLQLAQRIGTSHQNISRWESGEVLPNIDYCEVTRTQHQ